MSDAASQLDSMVATLRGMETFVQRATPAAGKAAEASLRADLAAGREPGGTMWKPTKAGTAPLKNAASYVEMRTVGASIVFSVRGRYVFHHTGTKKLPKRHVIPTAKTPPAMNAAIKQALVSEWNRGLR